MTSASLSEDKQSQLYHSFTSHSNLARQSTRRRVRQSDVPFTHLCLRRCAYRNRVVVRGSLIKQFKRK